jgi:hypothetical protein
MAAAAAAGVKWSAHHGGKHLGENKQRHLAAAASLGIGSVAAAGGGGVARQLGA